jgi:predicted Zn-dependent protease
LPEIFKEIPMKSEILLSEADSKIQKQAGKARQAIEKGDLEGARDILRRLLETVPGCLELRQWLHQARATSAARNKADSGGLLKRMRDFPELQKLSRLVQKNPQAALIEGEHFLENSPTNRKALQLLAEAANAADLPRTAVFLYRELLPHHPKEPSILLALGESCLKAEDPTGAVKAAEEALRLSPAHPEALEFMKRASVASSLQSGGWAE